jgi:hypothetical protein
MDGTPAYRCALPYRPREVPRSCLVLLIAATWLAGGCHNDPYLDAHIELQNAARRALEDQLYDLQFDYQAKESETKRLRAENDRLQKRGATAVIEPSNGPDIQPPDIELPEVPESATPAEPSPEENIGPLRPPTVDPGVPTDPPAIDPSAPLVPRPGSAPSAMKKASGGGTPPLDARDSRVTHVHINQDLTGLRDWDGKAGEDGLLILLEPRNQQDKYVPLAGPVSVVVLDPAEPGERKRVARWDLDALEVHRQMRVADSSRGIPLQLPWPENLPKNPHVQLYVRYVTADGRKLEDAVEISLPPSLPLSDRWTPRSNPSPSSAADEGPPLNAARPEWKPYR